MANTPEGTPYVESSDLVANYPAASLSLANRVDLVGILPFANAAARTTAIPTPTDGQYSYLQDTNATEFWNGAAWVPAGTPPGLVQIATQSFTTSSGIVFNNVFTSTFRNYKILHEASYSTGATSLLRMRVGGVDNASSVYRFQVIDGTGGTLVAANVTDTFFSFGGTVSPQRYVCDVMSPQIAANTSVIANATYNDGASSRFTAGTHQLTTAYDGISITPSSGTFTGQVTIYGYRNS